MLTESIVPIKKRYKDNSVQKRVIGEVGGKTAGGFRFFMSMDRSRSRVSKWTKKWSEVMCVLSTFFIYSCIVLKEF